LRIAPTYSSFERLPKFNIMDTVESVQNVMDQLDNRPRKTLDYATPNEVFFGKHWKHAA
jgi:IS30 family transposase